MEAFAVLDGGGVKGAALAGALAAADEKQSRLFETIENCFGSLVLSMGFTAAKR